MKRMKKEAVIGLISIIALALLYMGFNFLKGINVLKKKNIYYAKFERVHNVSVATPVLLDGFKVGIVKDMEFDYDKGHGITLVLDLDPKVSLPSGTMVAIQQTALSGAEIHLIGGPEGVDFNHRVQPGTILPSTRSRSDLLATATQEIFPAIVDMLPKIDSTLSGLSSLANDSNLRATFASVYHVIHSLEATTQRIDRIIGSMSNDMTATMKNMNETTKNTAAFSSNLKQLDVSSVQKSLDNIERLTAELQETSRKLKTRDNTAGLFLNDDKLYKRIDSLANSADLLMRDIKANPKRYVRFSLF